MPGQVKATTGRTVAVFAVPLMLPLAPGAPGVSLRLLAVWQQAVPLTAVVNDTSDPCCQVGGGAFVAAGETVRTANKAIVHRAKTRHTKRASVFMRPILLPRSGRIKRGKWSGGLQFVAKASRLKEGATEYFCKRLILLASPTGFEPVLSP